MREQHFYFPIEKISALFDFFSRQDYEIIAPVIEQEVVRYRRVSKAEELARGMVDHQSPGQYRLSKDEDHHGGRFFSFTVGLDSWRRFLTPAQEKLWQSTRRNGNLEFEIFRDSQKRLFFGVRPCELKALMVTDKVFLSHQQDRTYSERRQRLFLIAVNCVRAAESCFCTSFDSGPRVKSEWSMDWSLTEVKEGSDHFFLVQGHSQEGVGLVEKLKLRQASFEEIEQGNAGLARADQDLAKNRQLPQEGLKELLYQNLESPFWNQVAERCLSCANCTLVCPTCFCSTTSDSLGLDQITTTHERSWASCFNAEHSYIHGGSVRSSIAARYRQWLVHKLGSWHDQFGESGCVGCGRCITWCPVGIDLRQSCEDLAKLSAARGPGDS